MALPENSVFDNGSVAGATGARVSGCRLTTPARTGAGVYTLTLSDGGIPATECVVLVTPRGTGSGSVRVAQTSATVKTVQTFVDVAGVPTATDLDFDFKIERGLN